MACWLIDWLIYDGANMTVKSGAAKLAGVIGWPVAHSRSPRLHGYWLDHYGIDGAYVPLPVAPENLAQVVPGLANAGFAGINVTLPHKETIIALLDEIDPAARRIGAVNTVIFDNNGNMTGQNTDAFGFMENIRDRQPQFDLSGQTAVVLGAGGAARAVIVALLDAGVSELRLSNRTAQKAAQLSSELDGNISIVPWAERSECLANAGFLVNTTNLGMTGQPPLEIALDVLPETAIVHDIVYTPLQTDLLAQAANRGLATIDGLGMLLHQARPGFEAWFGQVPVVDEALRTHVLAGS